jgi:hypothetical protein
LRSTRGSPPAAREYFETLEDIALMQALGKSYARQS